MHYRVCGYLWELQKQNTLNNSIKQKTQTKPRLVAYEHQKNHKTHFNVTLY